MNRLPVQHVVISSNGSGQSAPGLQRNRAGLLGAQRKDGLKGGGTDVRLYPISSNITTADFARRRFLHARRARCTCGAEDCCPPAMTGRSFRATRKEILRT